MASFKRVHDKDAHGCQKRREAAQKRVHIWVRLGSRSKRGVGASLAGTL